MDSNATNPICVILSVFFALFQGVLDISMGFVTLLGLQVPQISDYLGSIFGCNI